MSAMTPTALCNQMVADNHWSWDIYLDKDPNRHVAYMRLPLSPDESSKSYSRQMLLDSLAELAGLTVSVVTRLSHESNDPAKVHEVVIDSLYPPLQKIVDWTRNLGFRVYEWNVFPPVFLDTETPIVAEGNGVADLLRALMKVEAGKWIVVARASKAVFKATEFLAERVPDTMAAEQVAQWFTAIAVEGSIWYVFRDMGYHVKTQILSQGDSSEGLRQIVEVLPTGVYCVQEKGSDPFIQKLTFTKT